MKKLICIASLTFLLVFSGFAQDDGSIPDHRKVPTLYGHAFPSMGNFKHSFINTHLQANLGFGLTSLITLPGLEIGGYDIFSFQGRIMFINTGVRYQQKFNDWLALIINARLTARVGTSMSTIVVDGVNTISGGKIGWLIKIYQSNRLNLSTTAYVKNLMGSFINVSDYFEDIINEVPNPSVTKKVPVLLAGLSVQGAYAFSPVFGMQFQGELSYGESFNREKSNTIYSLGILGDVDFNPKHNVPIGLALGYILGSADEIVLDDGGIVNVVSARLGYTGASDFELGLQYTYSSISLSESEERPNVSTIMLLLKFYF